MINKPILSICIPTYNRHEYLDRCLESVRIQLSEHGDLDEKIEVVISDNCSSDATAAVAERYRTVFKNFKYVVNEKNVGFDMNVANVVSTASGIYCWYMGDDEVIINGGIAFLVDCLHGHQYDVVGIEGEPMFAYNEKYKKIKQYSKDFLVEVDDYNDFYFSNYLQGGFSYMVFNRESWLTCLDKEDYLDFWLYYENVAKMLVLTKKKMLYIKESLIMTGQDCRWAENGSELSAFVQSNRLRQRFVGFGFDKIRILKDLHNNRKRVVIILLRAKGHGLKCNLSNLRLMYNDFERGNAIYMIIATVIFFIPNTLIVKVRDYRKYLKNK